jgi:hypothetical protein
MLRGERERETERERERERERENENMIEYFLLFISILRMICFKVTPVSMLSLLSNLP